MGDAYEREDLRALIGKVVQAADDSARDDLITMVQGHNVSGAINKVKEDGRNGHAIDGERLTVEITAAGTLAMTDMTAFKSRSMNTVAVMLAKKLRQTMIINTYSEHR